MEEQDSGLLQITEVKPLQYKGGDKVRVVVSYAPILSPVIEEFEPGLTVSEILSNYRKLHPDFCEFQINGEPANLEDVPLEGDCLLIFQKQQSGLEPIIIAAIVAAVVGAAIGYFMYKNMPTTGPDSAERIQRITGAKNEPKPYQPWNVILGNRRVVPPYQAQPYIYWKGDDQYLKMLFNVGYGPLVISDIKIGNTPIASFNNVDMTVLDWRINKNKNTLRDAWPADIVQEEVGIDMTNEFVSRSVPSGTRKVTLDFLYPAGLLRRMGDGDKEHMASTSSVRYKVGFREITVVPALTMSPEWRGAVYRTVVESGGRYYLINRGGNGNIFEGVNIRDAIANPYPTTVSSSDLPSSGTYSIDLTDDYITTYGGNYYFYTKWLCNSHIAWERTTDQFRRGFSFSPINPYTGTFDDVSTEILAMQNSSFSQLDGDRTQIKFQWLSLTSERAFLNNDSDRFFGIDESTRRYPVLIALDIKATDQVNGVIENFNLKAKSLVPFSDFDWKDYDIVNNSMVETNNPALLYKWALQGPFNPLPVDINRIDGNSLAAWELECNNKGWETSELINYEVTFKELLNNIAFTGRAEMAFNEGKFSVSEFKAKEWPKQIFTPKNSWGFSSKRDFPTKKKGIKYKFQNADFEDQVEEAVWYSPAVPEAERNESGDFESVEFWGVSNPDLAKRHARFIFHESRLKREVYELKTDIENLVVKRGDRVKLSHEVIDVGLGQGFIKSVSGDRLTTDEVRNLVAGGSYTLQIRTVTEGVISVTANYLGDGLWDSAPYTNILGNVRNDLTDVVSPGDLVVYGNTGNENLDCIVSEIKYSQDYGATLTMTNYSTELFNLDDSSLPAFETGLVDRDNRKDIVPSAPLIQLSGEPYSFDTNSVSVRVTKQQSDKALVESFSLQYKIDSEIPQDDSPNGEGNTSWKDGGTSPASSGRFTVPVELTRGNRIIFRAKAINVTGLESPYSEEKELVLTFDPAADVLDFNIEENKNSPPTPDSMFSTLVITVTPPFAEDSNYLYSLLEYKLPSQSEYLFAGKIGWKFDNKAEVQVLANGTQYQFRVRSVSLFGVPNKLGVSKLFRVSNLTESNDPNFEPMPVPDVTGLQLYGNAEGNQFGGKHAKFVWNHSSFEEWDSGVNN